MLTQVRLTNVRLFDKDEWPFDLRPLTIICGTNSSGKSTIIKSLLLLGRALSSDPTEPGLSVMPLADREIDVGPYDAFVSHGDEDLAAAIGITIDAELELSDAQVLLDRATYHDRVLISCDFEFGPEKAIRTADLNVTAERRSSSYRARLRSARYGVTYKGEKLLGWEVRQRDPGAARSPYILSMDLDSATYAGVPEILLVDPQAATTGNGVGGLARETLMNGLYVGYISGPAPTP
ncbi:MAG TPA: ATP-binding protein, partial [Xanthomonadales bacterium]|nr:ATP-binding protein [Xanthomonadales bacterium]